MQTYNHKFENQEVLLNWLQNINTNNSNQILVQIFSGIDNKIVLKDITKIIKKELKNPIIIGTSTAGEILEGEMQERSIVISVSIFEKTYLCSYMSCNKDSYEMGSDIAKALIKEETKVLIIFADGLLCNGEAILRGIDENINHHIIISGGMAGDNDRYQKTFVMYDEIISDNSVVAVALNGEELKAFNSYALSWHEIGNNMEITKSKANIIYEINHKPIKEIYKEYFGEEVVKNLPISVSEFPLIFEYNGIKIARDAIAVENEGIVYAGTIPNGTKVRFGVANIKSFQDDSLRLYNANKNLPIESIFVYSCVARKTFLGKNLEMEIKPLTYIAPVIGFFTYGELYATPKNYALLNITTTILALSENNFVKKEYKKINFKNRHISLSTTALINLVEKTISELEKESKEKENTIVLLNQYLKAIDKSYITSKTDTNGIITDVNEIFCEISGYTKEKLIGTPHNIVRHPDVPKEIFRDLWQTIKSKKIWQGIVKNRKKNGKSYYVNATIFPLLDRNGNITGYAAIRDNITDIKFQQEKAEAILDSQESIVLVTEQIDDRFIIRKLNKRFFDLFDYKDIDDFLSKHQCICDLFIEKEGYLQKNGWMELLLEESDKSHLALMKDKFGKERAFSVKVNFIELESQNLIISTFSDVTELEEARISAQVAEHAKSAFLATMSHELRTPLNAIIGFSQILMMKKDMPFDSMKTFIEKINISGKHLLELVNNILDFTKIESNKMELNLQKIALKDIISNTIVLVENMAQQKNITINIENINDQILYVDSKLMIQVLLNILSNAVKFTPEGKNINISFKQENEFNIIEICDEGMGMTQEQVKTIFEPFTQIKEHQNEAIKGTGLGLAITKKIVELHNGKIEVRSKLKEGSCFSIILSKKGL